MRAALVEVVLVGGMDLAVAETAMAATAAMGMVIMAGAWPVAAAVVKPTAVAAAVRWVSPRNEAAWRWASNSQHPT